MNGFDLGITGNNHACRLLEFVEIMLSIDACGQLAKYIKGNSAERSEYLKPVAGMFFGKFD